ncbi:ferritin family protein [Thermodesulfobacteriota bacterium]
MNDDVRNLEKQRGTAKVLAGAIRAEENSCRYYRSLEKIYKGIDLSMLFGKLADEEEKHKIRLERLVVKL